MAVTSPDNLYSPDDDDGYALVQDLGLGQDTVQSALVRRANLYGGTVAERQAFTATAPEGVHWQDTTGGKYTWVMRGGAWVVGGFNVISASASSAAGWRIDNTVGYLTTDGWMRMRADFTRTGATISVPTTGDLANVTVGTIAPAKYGPIYTVAAASASGGRVASGEFNSAGEIRLGAVGGAADITTGSSLSLEATYKIAEA